MVADQDWQTLKELAYKYRNWGKWGPEDQVGTLNYITPEKILQAARLIRKGKVFSLSIPLDEKGPQQGGGNRRFNPMQFMIRSGRDIVAGDFMGNPKGTGSTDDIVILESHCATHWDALAHQVWEDQMWNGYDGALVSGLGAERNGVEHYRDRIVTRAVLLDLPRVKGVEYLEAGYAITAEELDEAASKAGVHIERGDLLLIRTGHMKRCRAGGGWGDYAGGNAPGLSLWTCEWIQSHEIAGIAMDTWGCEVRPNELKSISQPWHKVTIPNMGLLMGEMFDLEELAADCDEDNVYEFLLVAPPLRLTGGVGSPVNPIVIK